MSATDAFILRGFDLYPDAAFAISTFHCHLHGQLHAPLDVRRDWGRFTRTKRLQDAAGDLNSGWRAWVIQNGAIEGKTGFAAEVGYWWSPPTEDRQPIVYATAWGIPPFGDVAVVDGMSVFTWSGRGVIAAPMPRDLKAGALVARQLDVVVRAINAK